MRVARPAGLEPAISWFVASGKEAIGGSGKPLPLVSLGHLTTRGNPRKLRAATACKSFVSRPASGPGAEGRRPRLTSSPERLADGRAHARRARADALREVRLGFDSNPASANRINLSGCSRLATEMSSSIAFQWMPIPPPIGSHCFRCFGVAASRWGNHTSGTETIRRSFNATTSEWSVVRTPLLKRWAHAHAISISPSPRSSAATIAPKSVSMRRNKSALRVFPSRTHTTCGPPRRTLKTAKSSSLETIAAPVESACLRTSWSFARARPTSNTCSAMWPNA